MEIIIRENDSLPIYEQIVREVKKAIIKKEIMPGDMMPSIRALARELEISVITTKRAYEELEKEQLIYSVAGKGFYVKARNRELLKEDQIRQIDIRHLGVIAHRFPEHIALIVAEVYAMHMTAGILALHLLLSKFPPFLLRTAPSEGSLLSSTNIHSPESIHQTVTASLDDSP